MLYFNNTLYNITFNVTYYLLTFIVQCIRSPRQIVPDSIICIQLALSIAKITAMTYVTYFGAHIEVI